MPKYIKNLNHEEILNLSDQIDILAGQVVSKTLAQNDKVSMTLFGFDKNEEIGTHDSDGDAFVYVIDGVAKLTVDGREHIVKKGEVLIMPANKPHSVYAAEQFKMLLIVVFPK
ncbi:MAG: cupin domain-containing protein [Oscillospiraceae bacterium]|nr:cupin domain-containing protein [Oscillospiraceae bacterium]